MERPICNKCRHCSFISCNMGGEWFIDCYKKFEESLEDEYDDINAGQIRHNVQECKDFQLPDFDTDCWDEEGCFKPEYLPKLRAQIRLGSIYLDDYANSYGIDENEVCDMFERYEIWLDEQGLNESEENLIEWFEDGGWELTRKTK